MRVLELVRAGENIFYTGDAGTGKTFLLNRIIQGGHERAGQVQGLGLRWGGFRLRVKGLPFFLGQVGG